MPLPLISASLPSALRSSMERSQPSRPGPTRMMPSAPMPRRRSASRRIWPTESRRVSRDPARPGSRCLPLHACCNARLHSRSSWPRAVRPQGLVQQIERDRPPESAQVIRGSRRNQDACRRANVLVRRTASSTQVVEVGAVLNVRQQLAVAQRLAGRARDAGGAGRQGPHFARGGRPRIQPAKRSPIRRSTSSLAMSIPNSGNRDGG